MSAIDFTLHVRVVGPPVGASFSSNGGMTIYRITPSRGADAPLITGTPSASVGENPTPGTLRSPFCAAVEPSYVPMRPSLDMSEFRAGGVPFPGGWPEVVESVKRRNTPGAFSAPLAYIPTYKANVPGKGEDTLITLAPNVNVDSLIAAYTQACAKILDSFEPGDVSYEFAGGKVYAHGGGSFGVAAVPVELYGRLNSSRSEWAPASHVRIAQELVVSALRAMIHNARSQTAVNATGLTYPDAEVGDWLKERQWLTDGEISSMLNALSRVDTHDGYQISSSELDSIYSILYPDGVPDTEALQTDANDVTWWDRFWSAAKEVGGGVADFVQETDTTKLLSLGAIGAAASDSSIREWFPWLAAGAVAILILK